MARRLPTLLKRSASAALGVLPRSVLGEVSSLAIARLPERESYRLLSQLAVRHNIDGFLTQGTLGRIQGAASDVGVLRKYARDGVWARATVAIFEAFFGDGPGTFLDVGANIGLTTIPMARNPRITCHAFEPEPNNFRHLQRNVGLNCPHGNVTSHNLALFSREATLDFELSADNMGDHRLRVSTAGGSLQEDRRQTITVRAARLDDIVDAATVTTPLAIKIDTQGAEPHVIAGAPALLARASLVVLEYWPYGMRRLGGDPGPMLDALAARFVSGSVAKGDVDEEDRVQPIDAVIGRLRAAAASTDVDEYYDVVLRHDPA